MPKQEGGSYWSMPADTALKHFESSRAGLSSQEADARLSQYGENVIKAQRKTSQLRLFIGQFTNPIILILIIATIISGLTGEWIDATIILLIILASAILSFFQEYRASNAVEELRARVQVKSDVLRDGQMVEVPSRELVVGDIVRLTTGSLVPADGLILESLAFFVNQSILTGESLPVEKKPAVLAQEASTEERTNCVFMGSNVQSGHAVILVTRTGENTEFGGIASQLRLRPPETEFERGVRRFGYLLTQIMFVLTLAVFAVNVILDRPPIDSLLFSVALAVGITPQLLPAIISITLSKGSHIMAHAGVIVQTLAAIENFGSMDVLCTDKTGTLTEGQIRLDGAVDVEGQDSELVFRLAFLNASLQSGMPNALDETIIRSQQIDVSRVKKQGEVPFDFTRERLSVIVRDEGGPTMITKGALNNILSICSRIQVQGIDREKETGLLDAIQERYATWSSQGIRVLGVAQKPVPAQDDYKVADETDMIFMGFLLLFDHPKPDVSKTIADLDHKGVSLRIITGDNKLIALHTAEAVGLEVEGVLTGPELMKLSDESLWNRIETTTLFAEVDPNQKERIILALKKNNHVVGYMGDGINDVPALHAADVSISVDNAVDVAKESADLVLMEKTLEVLNRGIELGRTTFGNTLKYILFTTSANFGNMFSMAGASMFLPFLPLLPKQILLINFLTDFPAITIANDAVDDELLERSHRWDIRFIRNFMFTFGLISSFFDYLTFAVLFLGFHVQETGFQSGWFVFSILTELLILMVMRTRRPFYRSRPAPILLYSSIVVAIITLFLPYLPLHQLLSIEPLPPGIIVSLLAIVGLYILATEIIKHYFFRRHPD